MTVTRRSADMTEQPTVPSPAGSTEPEGDDTPPRRGRGRRPAEEVRDDVLRVVGEVLLREGIADLTMERISRLSGVSKTTIYKWWPSVGVLALDGYSHAVEEVLHFPDTGDIRADLIEQMTAFAHVMTGTPGGRVLAQLIGQAQTDPNLAAAYRRLYSSQRRRRAIARLERARDLNQIRDDVDLQAIVDQLWGAVYHRLLIPDEPVTSRFVTSLVDNLLLGVAVR